MDKKILIIVVFIILLLMSGCSVNVGGDKINFTGNIALDKGTTLTEELNTARNAAEVERLDISNNAGDITVKRSSADDISIKAVKKVKGTNEDIKKEIMQNIDIIVDNDGNKLSVYPSTKDGKKDDLWKWVDRLYKGAQVTIDLELEVPDNVKVYNVSNNAGKISFEEIAGELDLEQNAGNISLKDVSLTGSNNIKNNAGNINISADINKAEKLSINSTASNIKLELPEKAAFELEIKLNAGNISGDFLPGTHVNSGTFKQQINGGGTKVIVTTVAGNVIINNK